MLVFLLGGARSGKSGLAVRLASRQKAPVVFLATGEARDEEMAERIALHRQQRPGDWRTIEEPRGLTAAITAVAPEACLIIDCLSLWVSNLLEVHTAAEIEQAAAAAAHAARDRAGLTIVVSNEAGLGLVPLSPLGRTWRDLIGRVNTTFSTAADRAYFVIAGRALALEDAGDL